jgi:hypothetical protein
MYIGDLRYDGWVSAKLQQLAYGFYVLGLCSAMQACIAALITHGFVMHFVNYVKIYHKFKKPCRCD